MTGSMTPARCPSDRDRAPTPYAGAVTSTRLLPLAAAAALLLSLTACGSAEPTATPTGAMPTASAMSTPCEGDEGVTVVVDATALGETTEEWCVFTREAIVASDVLERAGITTEGTEEYGDQIVCRVDGLPADDQELPNPDGTPYVEECAAMPAAFAYWSMWVKPAGGEWAYAMEGNETQLLSPGESFGLLFTLNGEPATPAP